MSPPATSLSIEEAAQRLLAERVAEQGPAPERQALWVETYHERA